MTLLSALLLNNRESLRSHVVLSRMNVVFVQMIDEYNQLAVDEEVESCQGLTHNLSRCFRVAGECE